MAASTIFTRGVAIIRRHRIAAGCLAAVVALLCAFLLFVWLALPYIVRTQAVAYLRSHGDNRLTIERVAIAPLFEPSLRIDNLRLTQADGSLLLAFRQFAVQLSLADLLRGAVVIDAIKLDGPQASITLLPQGHFNWDTLLGAPPAKGSSENKGSSAPPGILIHQFALTDGQIDLADRRGATPQAVQIKPLAITLTDLSTLPSDKKGAYALTATTSLGARIDWSGTVSLTPLSVAGSLRLDQLSLPRLAALLPLPPKLAPPQGTLTMATRYDAGMIGDKFDFKLADLALAIDGLRLAVKDRPDAAFALGHVGLAGGAFDWGSRQVAIQAITLSGGGVSARRLADGGIDLLDLMPAASSAPPAAPKTKAAAAPIKAGPGPSSPTPAWHYRVGRLALAGFAAEFRDESVTPAADIVLQDVTAEVTGVSENLATALPTHLALRLRDGGSVTVDGSVIAKAPSADLRIKIDGLALTPVQPYLGTATVLRLVHGTVSAAGQLRYPSGGGSYTGGLAVQDLRIMLGNARRPFLAWKSLSTDSLTASPAALDIRDLRLDGLDTALTVAKDRSINLTQILRPPPHPAGGHSTPPPPHAAAAPPAESHPAPPDATPQIEIGRFRISRSQLDFADLSLALPFATHIHDLEGTISRLSTRPKAGPARVKLKGRVDEDGTASAAGRFDLLQPTELLDIDVGFDNIELTNLTPYLATFAGRRIDSGKLTLQLQYKINHGQLAGENRIILDHFTLGGRVRSPEARDLPLDFAIALLKDSHGRIDLGIPISGSLADPKFSYSQLLWKTVSNILTRLVTSPFRAIGSLFGGGSDDGAAKVTFPAGQASLTAAAQKALAEVAASLNSRPTLAVTIHGSWSEVDRVALKEQRLRRALADKLELPAGADLSGLDADEPKVQPALEDLYADRHGHGELMALKDGYRQSNTGKLEDSVGDQALSLVTGLLGRKRDLGAAEIAAMKGLDFHAMLYQKLRDGEDVPNSTLEKLARDRGDTALAALRAAHVPDDRVTLKPTERVSATGHDVPLDMALSAAVKGP